MPAMAGTVEVTNTPIPTPINTPIVTELSDSNNTVIETTETYLCSYPLSTKGTWCIKVSRNGVVISDTPISCGHRYAVMSCECGTDASRNGCYRITNRTITVTSTPSVIATPTPATPTNTPIPIVSPTPSEVDKNDASIVQPCEDNNKMCESINKNGVIIYKGSVYPETIDVNNPSEPIFPIKDPNYKNHVGISHPCTLTSNTPTYSQICDASYINGRLTYIMKYTHKEYPCSSDVSGICRENSQESIPVRTPIVLTNTPIPTTNNPTQVNYYPVTSPEQTVTNTPEPTSQQVTTGGYAKINSISQDTVVEQDKSIIEKIKELFTNIWKEYVG
jgi:hypothetical protein